MAFQRIAKRSEAMMMLMMMMLMMTMMMTDNDADEAARTLSWTKRWQREPAVLRQLGHHLWRMEDVCVVVTLIRTATTLDHSQKAEEV